MQVAAKGTKVERLRPFPGKTLTCAQIPKQAKKGVGSLIRWLCYMLEELEESSIGRVIPVLWRWIKFGLILGVVLAIIKVIASLPQSAITFIY